MTPLPILLLALAGEPRLPPPGTPIVLAPWAPTVSSRQDIGAHCLTTLWTEEKIGESYAVKADCDRHPPPGFWLRLHVPGAHIACLVHGWGVDVGATGTIGFSAEQCRATS